MLRAELKVVGGKQHGSLIPLQTKKFLVGREQDCQLRPNSESVSRHHCVFTIDDFGVRLRDLGSTNGTFVNGKRVQGQVLLEPDDRILIGKLEFEIVIHDAVPAVQHARVVSAVSDSNVGFMVTDLAEVPESAPSNETIMDIEPTTILDGVDESATQTNETRVMTAEDTGVRQPIPPAAPAPLPQAIPSEAELPVNSAADSAILSGSPLAPSEPTTQPQPQPMQALPVGMPMAPQGMPMPGAPMMQPYGMPGAYPQPQYLQAPFASYTPPYMPNPYGMQQPYMPQPYVDPAYQQMAYQQQLAQQHLAHQQAMMSGQYAPQPTIAAMPEMEADAEEAPTAVAPPPVKLPPPEETGAKPPAPPPPPTPGAEGAAAPPPAAIKPNQLAADIIKKYMNRG